QKASQLTNPDQKKRAFDLIDSINRQVLAQFSSIDTLCNKNTSELVNSRPGCGAPMRAGCIGRGIAQSLGDPTKISPAEFRQGLSLVACLALSLSRITHPQAGGCLAAAVHAVTIYLISLDVPLHTAQEIALELFNREKEPGSKYYEYIK